MIGAAQSSILFALKESPLRAINIQEAVAAASNVWHAQCETKVSSIGWRSPAWMFVGASQLLSTFNGLRYAAEPTLTTGKVGTFAITDFSTTGVGLTEAFPATSAPSNKWTMCVWLKDLVFDSHLGNGRWVLSVREGGQTRLSDSDDNFTPNTVYTGFVLDTTDVTDGNWHRFIVMHDPDTRTFSLKVNEGPLLSFVSTAPLLPAARFDIKTGGTIDEVYLCDDYNWTEAEMTHNWNGGAGRTFPDVPKPFGA